MARQTATIILVGIFIFSSLSLHSQEKDSTKTIDGDKIKTGWTFGAVPAIAYDSDIGFKYGGVVNFYNYGDGTTYPKYLHSLYFEWSRTTKGSGINQFTYDSEHLIPKVRVSAEASLLTEKALDFYGFNGYESKYIAGYEDDESDLYISRMFYKQERKLTRIKTDFQGQIIGKRFKWFLGLAHYGIKLDTVDIDNLNKGQDEEDKLPYTDGGLFGKYLDLRLIPEKQSNGGQTNIFRFGLVYDTRDNEPNPMKGIWTDAQLILAPSFLGNDYAFTKLAITHRQYFTLIPKKLNFAYRIGYQDKISGEMPFYMLPFVFNIGRQLDRDGLGGAKTLRGILRNRIVGEDFIYSNFELRWKFLRTIVFNQNLYLALSGFVDAGQVTGKYKLDTSPVPDEISFQKNTETVTLKKASLFPDKQEKLHVSYGAGLHIALNQNFVVAIDYGIAADENDGDDGLYIGLNFLF